MRPQVAHQASKYWSPLGSFPGTWNRNTGPSQLFPLPHRRRKAGERKPWITRTSKHQIDSKTVKSNSYYGTVRMPKLRNVE